MAKPDCGTYCRYLLWTFSILFHKSITALTDNRCFLENAASSENFFVAEDLPVGSIIGQIHVHGEPRTGGSIGLRLKEKDSPIAITPGTKNLTLRKQLDKEGVDGPSSVFVNLICERIGTLDPGFVIPINVRVTDVNDNAPVFINAPYILNISEVTVVGTRVLQGVHAVDNDQQGIFSSVKYSVLPGQNSDFFEFENELEGTLVLKKPLDYENLKSFDVHIRAQDHGEPPKKTDTILTVNVVDADDQNPKFQDDRYTSILPEPPKKGSLLIIKPREIRASDQDLGINSQVYYTFNEVGVEYTFFKLNRLAGKISLSKDLSENDIPYPVTLVVRATQQDNPDRYALATLTVSRNIAKGIRFLHSTFYIKASEALPSGAVIGTLSNNRPGEQLRYFVSDQNILKTFSLNTKGELSLKKKLDYEDKPEFYFKVFATDGITNDSSVVNISVENVNEWEPRFRYPHYEFFISGHPEELLGKIEAADGDKNDKLSLALSGANTSIFTISQNGELRLKSVKDLNVGMVSFAVVATDNGRPPRSSTVPVTVHFPEFTDKSGTFASKKNNGGSLLLAGLGAILLVLLFVVVLLVAYICKVKRGPRSDTSTLQSEKDSNGLKKITNPMFGDLSRAPTASAMGGIPTDIRSKIPSPKVHPAPQPPLWGTDSSRVKKLSWGDDKIEFQCCGSKKYDDWYSITWYDTSLIKKPKRKRRKADIIKRTAASTTEIVCESCQVNSPDTDDEEDIEESDTQAPVGKGQIGNTGNPADRAIAGHSSIKDSSGVRSTVPIDTSKGNTPFSCCSMSSIFPCIHHNIEVTGKAYLYTPEQNLSISIDGCHTKLKQETIEVGWNIIGNLVIFIILQVALVIGLRFLQTAHFARSKFEGHSRLYTVWLFGRGTVISQKGVNKEPPPVPPIPADLMS